MEGGLDLKKGDYIALLPTSYDSRASDKCHILSYDNITGIITINSTLQHYHWGASTSTASKYNGIDIRGEVVILTRNI